MSVASVAASSPHRTRGILLYSLAIFLLAVMDASAKWLTHGYPVGEIIFFRSLFALPILLVLGLRHSSAPVRLLATAHPWRHLLRGVVVMVTIVTFFMALRHLPLATVTVITLANPIFMLLLGLFWLGEQVGRRQWLAVGLGLIGVMVVCGLSGLQFNAYSLLAVASALSYALATLLTRQLSAHDSPATIAMLGTLIMLLFSAISMGGDWQWPGLTDWLVLLLLGLSGGLANFVNALSLRDVPLSAVAPLEYSILLWAAALGYFFFAEMPGMSTWLGGALIIASGVVVARAKH
ncbi:DMT family transporter [Aquitalea aquatica]|uniref:DMT family transporter n=1 Tax=Aquitalea aquatica TaxID=3044273 RepID=A0A838Y5Q4_9NEIS|nr:DMT family transporter [Aquitalea magnusonii]MBA4710780.1 DMT family transporter [Aquitalea magnusonii]